VRPADPFAGVRRRWLIGRLLITLVGVPALGVAMAYLIEPDSDFRLILCALGMLSGLILAEHGRRWLETSCVREARRVSRRTRVAVPEEWQ
jgi:hypothetical protein